MHVPAISIAVQSLQVPSCDLFLRHRLDMSGKDFASVLAELGEVNDLVATQAAAGMSRDDVVESLFSSWNDRLSRMKTMTTKQKGELTGVMLACTHF
jgi:hypothetical protein